MDELIEKKRRGPLHRALARRIKAWADGVFSKRSEPAPAPGPQSSPREAPALADSASAWRKSLESRTGPPAEWQEFVQRNAQKGAVRAGNSGRNKAVPPPPRPVSPEEAVSASRAVPPPPQREQETGTRKVRWPAQPEARLEGTPEVPAQPLRSRVSRRATPPGVLSFEPISYTRQPVQAPRPAPPLSERPGERPLPRFESLAEPVAAPPRRSTPEQDPRPTVLHMPAASNSETREAEATAGTQSSPIPAEVPASAPQTVRLWNLERPPVASDESPSRAEPLYPWKEEPRAAPRRPSRQIPLEDLDTLINRSWPPLANEAEPKKVSVSPAAPEPLEEHRGGPWPELPEPPPADSTEAQAALRQWERLIRLDREQRGE